MIAAFNVALALETEDLALDPSIVRPGVEAVLGDPARGVYFVADAGGTVIGQVLVTFEWSDWRNGNLWWLQSVYVEKESRSHGVFKALFAHVISEAKRKREVCGLRLYMETENHRAREVYRRIGMSETRYQVFEQIFPRQET